MTKLVTSKAYSGHFIPLPENKRRCPGYLRVLIPAVLIQQVPPGRSQQTCLARTKAMEPSLSPTSTIQGGSSDAGAEPGIDPRLSSANEKYSHFEEDCAIDIIDYSAKDATFQRMHNSEFVELMYDTAAQKRDSPPPHWTDKKGSTPFRWISITGIDWNVLSSLALRYGKVALSK